MNAHLHVPQHNLPGISIHAALEIGHIPIEAHPAVEIVHTAVDVDVDADIDIDPGEAQLATRA